MVSKEQVFSNDFLVCLKILEFNLENEKIWFSKLVKEMNGTLAQSTISKSLDKLSDIGMIEGEWEHADGCWMRTLKVTDESLGFVRGLYNVCNGMDGRPTRGDGSAVAHLSNSYTYSL